MRHLVPQTPHGCLAVVSMAIAAALPAGAVAKTETGANISLSTAVASNPFLSTLATTGDPESVSASIGISPWITFTEAKTRLRLAGEARITEYAKTFPRSESFRLSADGTWQLDPRLNLSSAISYSESIVGETNLIGNTELGGSLPGENTTPVVIVDDPTLVGLRSRRRSLNTSLNAQYRPDGRQIWTFSFYAADSRFSNLASGNDYAIYGETVSYDRVLRRGTFGASLNLQRYECRSFPACSQVVASPQLTASIRLSGLWTLSASAGISYSTLRLPTLESNTVTPSVSANICRRDAKISVCVGASHTVEATALQGSRPILSANVSTSYRVTERNTLAFSGNYSGSTRAGVLGDTFRYVGARLSDEHRVSRNMHVVVTGSHTISDSSFIGQRTNTEVSIGVRISIGRGQ